MDNARINTILKNALWEDIGSGDITTCAVIPKAHKSSAELIAKETFILSGLPFAERVFKLVNPRLKFKADKKDGDTVEKGTIIAKIRGSTRSLLIAERTALNLLQRLSGIATLTHRFVEQVKGLPVKIMDTRKTTPGLRVLEKYAVKAGGGHNHRFGLFDGVLIKDNHIHAAGGIKNAVRLAKKHIKKNRIKIEVEAKNIREVKEALSSYADIIMLDNMPLTNMRKAVKIIRWHSRNVIIEASGNINLKNIRKVAETGVDLISIGALTHSARAVDISMDVIS